MKKILIIDESALFRQYLAGKLTEQNFQVVEAHNGLDGSLKMRSELPDLVIMDYYLSRKSSLDILKEKKANPNTADAPVVIVSSKIDKTKVLQIAGYNVKKLFSKPLKIDSFLHTMSELLGVELKIDDTPCIIEAHFNDDILFVEIARGLNREKMELLRYKITELQELYGIRQPRILIMMSNMELSAKDQEKLSFLLNSILEHTNTKPKHIKILTNAAYVREFLASRDDLEGIEVTDSLDKAMDDLLGIKPDQIAHDEVVSKKLLSSTAPKREREESVHLRFDSEKVEDDEPSSEYSWGDARVAIVDDDLVIQELVKTVFTATGWKLEVFNNGMEFTKNLKQDSFDLVFLDLLMPEMNGFQVLQFMKQQHITTPVIIFSALSRKETVSKAVSYGVRSYLIKPLKPDQLLLKAAEAINMHF
ncbi:MAG: response regulator [Spirochaetales bacterium]|nr:response regulator [Spirochaetales bacterium]